MCKKVRKGLSEIKILANNYTKVTNEICGVYVSPNGSYNFISKVDPNYKSYMIIYETSI